MKSVIHFGIYTGVHKFGLILGLVAILVPAWGRAATVAFTTFTAPVDPNVVGATWTFDDVASGVDMTLEAIAFSSGAQVGRIATSVQGDAFNTLSTDYETVAIDPGFLRIATKSASSNTPGSYFVTYQATFVVADTTTPTTLSNLNFLIRDVDLDNTFSEKATVANINSYTLNQDGNLVVQETGPGEFEAESEVSGNTGSTDPDAMYGFTYDEVSSFVFRWGFDGSAGGNRGMDLDGQETSFSNVLPQPVTTVVPEPSSAALLGSIALLLFRRRR